MRHRTWNGRFPVQAIGASTPWRGAKEVSGVALVVAQEVPTSSSMAVPHGPAGVGEARHRMRDQLRRGGVAESVIDDAVLILSELLSNACKHGRPLGGASAGDGDVRAAWRVDAGGR
ncbi:ATP-binding protein, partial [Streptomyces carpinensis]